MTKIRATGRTTFTRTELEWWSNTAAGLQTANQRYPKVASAERVPVGETRVYHQRVDGEPVPVLAVSATDIDTHTDTDAGRWIVANSLSWAQYPPRQHKPGYGTPLGMLAAVLILLPAAFSHDVDSSSRLTALVAAAMLVPAGLWLLRYRRRRFQDRTWAADSEATSAAGLPAAQRLLTTTEPALYKTIVHTWINQRRTTAPAARLQRLQQRERTPRGERSTK